MATIKLKRAYDPYAPSDGTRILVERLWPRGVSKEHARLDYWAKDIAPSPKLRKWFNHDPAKWPEFTKRYLHELKQNMAGITELKKHLKGTITFIYAAPDTEHNSALVLKDF